MGAMGSPTVYAQEVVKQLNDSFSTLTKAISDVKTAVSVAVAKPAVAPTAPDPAIEKLSKTINTELDRHAATKRKLDETQKDPCLCSSNFLDPGLLGCVAWLFFFDRFADTVGMIFNISLTSHLLH